MLTVTGNPFACAAYEEFQALEFALKNRETPAILVNASLNPPTYLRRSKSTRGSERQLVPYPRPNLVSRYSSKNEQLAIGFRSEQEEGSAPLMRPSTQAKDPAGFESKASEPRALTNAPSQAGPQISVSTKEPRFFITEDEVADARRAEQEPRVDEESKA